MKQPNIKQPNSKPKLFSVTEALTMLAEEVIPEFTWLFSDHAQAIQQRNAVTSLAGRRKNPLKVTTTLVKAVRNDAVVTFITVELAKNHNVDEV